MLTPTRYFVVTLAQVEVRTKKGGSDVRLVETIVPVRSGKQGMRFAREEHRKFPEHYHWVLKLQGEYAPGLSTYFKS